MKVAAPTCPIDIKHNCFTLIRYLAAASVLLNHCIEHFGLDKSSALYTAYMHTLGSFYGVPIFFGLSGFLIWAALDRNDDLGTYIKKRILRLYPELWVAVLLGALAVILLYGDKINGIMLTVFCFTQGTFLQFWTPDFLRGYGCGTPNGSLWTICTFVQFYIFAWIAHRLCKSHSKPQDGGLFTRKKLVAALVVLGLSLLFNIGYPMLENALPELIYKLLGQTLLPYLWLFVIGICVYEFRNTVIPLLARFWYIPTLLYYAVCNFRLVFVTGAYIDPLNGLLLLLSVFGIGYRFGTVAIKRDYSYGIYLYHMIVVNAILQTGVLSGAWALVVTVFATVVIAVASGETAGKLTSRTRRKSNIATKPFAQT